MQLKTLESVKKQTAILDRATLRSAFAECKRIALGHYENFPVGSVLIPKSVRPYFFALYAFMRTADDFADLPHRSMSERLALLNDWRNQLTALYDAEKPEPDNAIFIALDATIKRHALPRLPLERLLDAFTFDAAGNVQFRTFEDLRWYTQRSAEPVGQLVLALFGYHDDARIEQSNAICTALQLINFLQDAKDDLEHGRNYFPLEDCTNASIEWPNPLAPKEALNKLVHIELARIEQLLAFGAPLSEAVTGRLRFELRAVLWGAKKMLKKLKRFEGQIFVNRPALSKLEQLSILGIAVLRQPNTF